eukprot:2172677-Prymnesium_polylepis.1
MASAAEALAVALGWCRPAPPRSAREEYIIMRVPPRNRSADDAFWGTRQQARSTAASGQKTRSNNGSGQTRRGLTVPQMRR